jgi:hypothetical protein
MQRAIPDRLHDAEHVDIAEERSAPLDRGKLHRREELFQFPGQLTADVLIEVKAHGKCGDLANHTRWSTVLLGVGVAFKIYYIMAWRRAQTDFLQSALTRAVFFSALLTATAFGSLWLSTHPGTSTMGKLQAFSLACTLISAVLFQPALMGEPRVTDDADADARYVD